jgi:hypothetical protein
MALRPTMRWTALLLPLASCSVDSPAPDHTSFVTCEEISLACHNVDLAEDGGIGEDCHVVSHLARSEVPCQREKAMCLAYCSLDAGFDAQDWADSGSRIIPAYLPEAGADADALSDGGSDQ